MSATNRSLDRVRKTLQKMTRAMSLDDKIRFELDRANKAIAVFATDGASFMEFDRVCRSVPERYEQVIS